MDWSTEEKNMVLFYKCRGVAASVFTMHDITENYKMQFQARQNPCLPMVPHVHNAYETGEKRHGYKQNTLGPNTHQEPNTVQYNILKIIYFN